MTMQIVNLIPNTFEWEEFKASHHGASEAASMMGDGAFISRDELLANSWGGAAEVCAWKQKHLFGKGHEIEHAARPIIEAQYDIDLMPAVVVNTDYPLLNSSLDGLSTCFTTIWECKMWNDKLAEMVANEKLPPSHYWQPEQSMLLTGIDETIFTVSDGTPEKTVSMIYRPVKGRAKKLVNGWRQFESDRKNFEPVSTPAVAAKSIITLPSVSVQIAGTLEVTSNISAFGKRLEAFVEDLNLTPETDQDFVDCKAAIDMLAHAESDLVAAENYALAQIQPVDEMRKLKKAYYDLARNHRLMLEKVYKEEQARIKIKIRQDAENNAAAYVQEIDESLAPCRLPVIDMDFAGALHGLKTMSSRKNAANTELARIKIAVDESAEAVRSNLQIYEILADGHTELFPDIANLALKAADDFTLMIKSRINEAQAKEAARIEADRARIRAEEEAKAQAKAEAEQRKRETEEKRVKAEEQEKVDAEQRRRETNERLAEEAGKAVEVYKQRQAYKALQSQISASPMTIRPPKNAAEAGYIEPKGRPTDAELIEVLTLHYRVHESKVIEWLLDMDLDAASEERAGIFVSPLNHRGTGQ